MPKLFSLSFANVGHHATCPNGLDVATSQYGKPDSTVAWLRDGGGKPSIFSLLCPIFVPELREITAKAEGRSSEGYVGNKGVAVLTSEWTVEGHPQRRQRAVGVAMERLSEEYGGLRRVFFSFLTGGDDRDPLFDMEPIHEFPLRPNGQQVRKLGEFSNWLRQAQVNFPEHDVYHSDTWSDWRFFLGYRDFKEPEFRLVASLNRREDPASEDMLRLRDTHEFVNFVLERTHDPQGSGLFLNGMVTAYRSVSETEVVVQGRMDSVTMPPPPSPPSSATELRSQTR